MYSDLINIEQVSIWSKSSRLFIAHFLSMLLKNFRLQMKRINDDIRKTRSIVRYWALNKKHSFLQES